MGASTRVVDEGLLNPFVNIRNLELDVVEELMKTLPNDGLDGRLFEMSVQLSGQRAGVIRLQVDVVFGDLVQSTLGLANRKKDAARKRFVADEIVDHTLKTQLPS